jgi:DNA-binding Lrp family transcriptional regulator
MRSNPGRFDDSGEVEKVKIDLRDKKILAFLSEDGRMPVSEIAKKLALSRDGVNYRINRLVKLGVIKKFFPIINLKKFCFNTFHVFMLLDELEKAQHNKLISDMVNHPNTVSVREYSDSWDIELIFIARNIKEMDEILMEIISKNPKVVLEKDKLEVIKGYNSIHLPYSFYGNIKKSFEWKDRKSDKKVELDAKDWKILDLLSKNCRMSTYEIGREVKLSPDAVSYRMKNLYDANIIRKYTILTDLTKLGFHWYTYTMQVRTFSKEYDSRMKEFVRNHPNIIRAIKTLGSWDFLLHIVTENPTVYHKTVKDIKNAFSDVIRSYQTWLGFKEYYYDVCPRIIMPKEDKK